MHGKPKALVVGTGFGCRIQIPALRAAGFDVAGLVGTDAVRTAERAVLNGVALSFTDLDAAITQTGATAVAISTPPHTHAPLALQAIARGCHVLCEKPFSMDLVEAECMLEAAERAGIVHALGNEFRWDPIRAMAARVLGEGAIGEPRLIALTQFMHYAGNPNVDLPHWWFDTAAGGGWLGAWGSHLIDWIRNWLGPFASLSATLPSVAAPDGGADDSFIIRFRLANGADGVIQQSAGAWGRFLSVTRIAGTKGTLWFEGDTLWVADKDGERAVPIAPDLLLPLAPPPSTDPRQQGPEWQMLTAVELAPYTELCKAWLARIEGRPATGHVRAPTFADGVENMRVLDAVRASAADDGRTVKVSRANMGI